MLADQRLDNGKVTGARGNVVHRVLLHVHLVLQQLVGLATEVDEGGRVTLLPGSEALAQQEQGALLVVLGDKLEGITQPSRVLASQLLDGGSVGAVNSGEFQRMHLVLVTNHRDHPLLGILLAQLDHALEQLDRSIVNNRSRKLGAPLLVLLVELVDRSLGRDRLDALARRVPRVALAEHEQRYVVHKACSERLEGGGGSADTDEAGEVAVLVGSGELAPEGHDSGAVMLDGVVQGDETVSVFSEQGWLVVVDLELDGGGIGQQRA